MSQISAIFGTDDDEEILQRLYTIANVSVARRWQLQLLTITTEYEWARSDTRVAIYLYCGLYATMVRMGQQLLCRVRRRLPSPVSAFTDALVILE